MSVTLHKGYAKRVYDGTATVPVHVFKVLSGKMGNGFESRSFRLCRALA